jgi:hypothetical protein
MMAVAGALVLAAPVFAGHPQKREGFWFGLGLGYGRAKFGESCDCSYSWVDQLTGSFRFGGTLNPKVLLGSEVNVWSRDSGPPTTLASATGTVTLYPQTQGGFFVKGGVGFSFVKLGNTIRGIDYSDSSVGWGVLAGIGYDARIAANVSLTLSVNYWYGSPGDLNVASSSSPDWKQNVASFELGLTFH